MAMLNKEYDREVKINGCAGDHIGPRKCYILGFKEDKVSLAD